MTGDLIINNKDAWGTWGVRMGDNFIDTIDAPADMKDYIENESRAKNGKQILIGSSKVASRQLTLTFTITGDSQDDYRSKKNAFINELQGGSVEIKIPVLNNDVYKLVYKGKKISYALSLNKRFSKFAATFEEPDPTDRS